jgi:hypothetical protein
VITNAIAYAKFFSRSHDAVIGDPEIQRAQNIRKREVSIQQLLAHIDDVIGTHIP